jgi:hypothetical protein
MKAIIKSKHFITEGGCNACKAFELETLTLHLENGKEVSLENLDVASLVTPFIQNEQWRTTLLLDEDEGYLYQKGNQEVTFIDNHATQVFVSEDKKIVCQKKACEQELFVKANDVLQQLFSIEPVEFAIEQA